MDDREADWQRMYRQENDARLAAEARAERAERGAVKAEEKAAVLLTKLKDMRARLDQAERERGEARAEQRDAEASRDLLVAGYTRAIREWLATHPGDSVPDVVDLFGAVMAERDEAGRAFRDLVAVLDRDGGQRQAGETIAGTLERAIRVAADAVVGADALREERDEARAAVAPEPARIAAAVEARDVAWVRACGRCVRYEDPTDAIARALGLPTAVALDVFIAAAQRDATDADIAAAIRAAKGE